MRQKKSEEVGRIDDNGVVMLWTHSIWSFDERYQRQEIPTETSRGKVTPFLTPTAPLPSSLISPTSFAPYALLVEDNYTMIHISNPETTSWVCFCEQVARELSAKVEQMLMSFLQCKMFWVDSNMVCVHTAVAHPSLPSTTTAQVREQDPASQIRRWRHKCVDILLIKTVSWQCRSCSYF